MIVHLNSGLEHVKAGILNRNPTNNFVTTVNVCSRTEKLRAKGAFVTVCNCENLYFYQMMLQNNDKYQLMMKWHNHSAECGYIIYKLSPEKFQIFHFQALIVIFDGESWRLLGWILYIIWFLRFSVKIFIHTIAFLCQKFTKSYIAYII